MSEGEGGAPGAAPADGGTPGASEGAGNQNHGDTLDFQGGAPGTEGGTPPGEGAGEGDKILGRFNSHEELEADWKRQNDLIRNRAGEMPDDALRAAAEERGLIQPVPEAYDFNAAVGDSGIKWKSRDEAPEAFDQITGALKEAGFTQQHLNAAMPLVQSIVQEAVRDFGAQVDTKAEMGSLTKEWGAETNTRGQAIRDWALANLPSEIFFKPLGATAEGMKFLDKAMRGERGAEPLTGDSRASFDPAKAEKELEEMRK
ncbi:MAG: hypothetical protein MJA83_10810, partial [Gammaproteobacteria bacterium]|nr:hypothetical protein [Gammaproteobacteria bacterium]